MATEPGSVTVRLPQALVADAGGAREVVIEAPTPMRLGDVLDELARVAPAARRRIQDETGAVRRYVNVFVGEDECRTLDGLDTVVRAGTVVHVIGSVAGG
jgi:sulfur-carrier protein